MCSFQYDKHTNQGVKSNKFAAFEEIKINNNYNNNNNNSPPMSSCCLLLGDEALRVAVGIRLGLNLCIPHPCPCGASVDCRGIHGLACKQSSGRSARYHY